MNITLKNIPAPLHKHLKERAARHGRSLNKEIIVTLESVVRPQRIDPDELLSQIQHRRNSLNLHLNLDDIESAIQEGRS